MNKETSKIKKAKARDKFNELFNKVAQENGLTVRKMAIEISKAGIRIPDTTLSDSLNGENANPLAVIAFCHRFNIDINQIYYPEDEAGNEKSNKSQPQYLYAKDFICSCFEKSEDIESIYLSFRSGGEWLEHDEEKTLLKELNKKGISVKVLVNHGTVIREMTDSMYNVEEKKMSLDVNDCVRLWGKFEENFNNLDVCISDLPILRRLTIVNFKNGKSKIFVRDYAYNFSEGWENASFTYDENDYLTDTFKKEFDYLWSKGRSFNKWVIDETNKSFETTNHLKFCSNEFTILKDEKFFGKYYGYCYNSDAKNTDSFELVIDYNSVHEVQADLYLHCKENRIVLHGVPMRIRDMIYIMFQEDTGDEFYAMGYKWFSINHGNRLYFRHGAFLTPVRKETRIPSVKSFIISDKPIEEKNMHYINGYLKLCDPLIFVRADSLENALKTNQLLKKYVETTKYDLTADKCYAIDETIIAQLGNNKNIDFDDIAETICLLKELSINPTLVSYPDNKTISKYIASLCKDCDQ